MQISAQKDHVLFEGSASYRVAVALTKQPEPQDSAEDIKHVGSYTDSEPANGGPINSPGEFEYHGLDIVAFDVKANKNAEANLFKISLDGVHTAVLTASPDQLAKQDWELLDEVHVFVTSDAVFDEATKGLIAKLQPYVVLIHSQDGEAFSKEKNITVESTAKKFSFKEKDFTAAEEVAAKYHILSK